MTTEDDFRRLVVADSANDLPRLQYADWLEENVGGPVPCGRCDGKGEWFDGYDRWKDCLDCSGHGVVSDGRRERAEFIRVQCELRDFPAESECDWGVGVPCRQCRRCGLRRREGELLDLLTPEFRAAIGPTTGRDNWSWRVTADPHERPDEEYTAVVRRGFVEIVRGPLAAFWGERACNHCRVGQSDERYPVCPDCAGVGRVSGPTAAFRELCRREPVTRVEVTNGLDRPYGGHDLFYWPRGVTESLGLKLLYDSEAAARDAVSAALISAARDVQAKDPAGLNLNDPAGV